MPVVREHPLLRVPVIFAPERSARPQPSYTDSKVPTPEACPFCPGSESGTPPSILTVGDPWQLRLFANRYPMLDQESNGAHEVLVESRRHEEVTDAAGLFETLRVYHHRMQELSGQYRYVSIFKNHGRWAGESIEHPHSQILATPFVPPRAVTEQKSFSESVRCPLCEMQKDRSYSIAASDTVRLFSPAVPRFAYETWIAPLNHESRFEDSSDILLRDTARMMALALGAIAGRRIARSWNWSVLTSTDASGRYHWYIEIIPRTAAIAGYELHSGAFVNTVPPELCASTFREST